MTPTRDKVLGCVLGLALGDALGAPYEGGVVERLVWSLLGIGKRGQLRWTDDTQMSIDVVDSFLRLGRVDQDDLAATFAKSYRWSRGYGPGAARVLKRVAAGTAWRAANRSVYPNGSFGNGAAMRAPIVGIIHAERPIELRDAAERSAFVTHAHPLGIEGAVLVAHATARVALGAAARDVLHEGLRNCADDAFTSRLRIAQDWLANADDASSRDVRAKLGNGIAAHESCVTALYLALRFAEQPFVALQRFVVQLGGDADTIGAMAGAIWGAANGYERLPEELLSRLEQRERLMHLASELHAHLSKPTST